MGTSAKIGRAETPGNGKIDANRGIALARRARNLRDREAVYFNYVDVSGTALSAMTAARTAELREEGHFTEGHDALLAQLKGLRARFNEVDAMARSLLLLAEEKGLNSILWEEVLAVMNSLQAIEMEARAAQSRAALATIFREYMGEKGQKTRKITLEVSSHLAKRFTSLAAEVRDIQGTNLGRNDAFSVSNLFERLVALGAGNPEVLVRLGSPNDIPLPQVPAGPRRKD